MEALTGPFVAAALLLVLAGGQKVADPKPLVRALRSTGLRLPAPAVRAFAVVEVVVGLVAVVTGSRLAAAAVALSYLAFTAFVALALVRGGVLASCGCFGKADTPPTVTHAVVTGAAALVAAAVAVRPVGPITEVLAAQPGAGVPLLLATAAVAVTGYLVLALLPMVKVAR